MSGRRSHERFALSSPGTGSVQTLREVVVESGSPREIVVLSRLPGVVNEELTLHLSGAAAELDVRVRVSASRPQMVAGHVRHRIRLEVLEPARG
jgi:hypothetical protein